MPRILVRAADSALAMDEVLDRLGAAAYILSIRQQGGMVEIEAASEPIVDTAPDPAPGPSFDALLRRRMAADVAGGVSGPALPPPGPAAPFVLWSPPAPGWLAALAADLERDPPEGPLAALAQVFPAQPEPWETARLVVTGPDPALVALTAARVAAAWMQYRPDRRPRLIEPRPPVLLTDTPLRGWARLLDLRIERDIAPPAAPPEARPELIALSALPDSDPGTAFGLAGDCGEVLLVLPAGLHPRRLARHVAPWRGSAARVCLSGIDLDPPQPDELMALAEAGLALRLLAWGSTILDSLALSGPEILRAWACDWLANAPAEQGAPSEQGAAAEPGALAGLGSTLTEQSGDFA